MQPARQKLSLPTKASADATVEREIDLDVIDALVPCRNFAITYKIAEVGKFSLTSEFLLRLVRAVEGIPEAEAAAYFGFSDSEIAYVVNDMETHGYVERRQGTLWLTDAGRGLFSPGSDEPELYEVEQRTERHGFDLVALAPAEYFSLSRFDASLPELRPASDRVASASKAVPGAFRKHFDSLVRRITDTPLKQSLYAVDTVTPMNRYSAPVPVTVRARTSQVGAPEPNLAERWTGYDLDDRAEIVEAAAALLKAVRVPPHFAGDEVFRRLADMVPNALSEYMKGGSVRRDAFYRETLRRAGELRVDRPTVPIVGTLFTESNLDRLKKALGYAVQRQAVPPRLIFWQAPLLMHWGATRRLPLILEAIPQLLDNSATKRIGSVGLSTDRAPRHLLRAFDAVVTSRAYELGLQALEVLLVPGNVTAVLVHTAMATPNSYPVPLGILSFDPAVVERTHELVRELLPTKLISQGDWAPDDLAVVIDEALAKEAEKD